VETLLDQLVGLLVLERHDVYIRPLTHERDQLGKEQLGFVEEEGDCAWKRSLPDG